MAAWLPLASGFTGFAHRFVDPALGFALGEWGRDLSKRNTLLTTRRLELLVQIHNHYPEQFDCFYSHHKVLV
jgi:hypothetical protein